MPNTNLISSNASGSFSTGQSLTVPGSYPESQSPFGGKQDHPDEVVSLNATERNRLGSGASTTTRPSLPSRPARSSTPPSAKRPTLSSARRPLPQSRGYEIVMKAVRDRNAGLRPKKGAKRPDEALSNSLLRNPRQELWPRRTWRLGCHKTKPIGWR